MISILSIVALAMLPALFIEGSGSIEEGEQESNPDANSDGSHSMDTHVSENENANFNTLDFSASEVGVLENASNIELEKPHDKNIVSCHRYGVNEEMGIQLPNVNGNNIGVVRFEINQHSQGKISTTSAVFVVESDATSATNFQDPEYCLEFFRKALDEDLSVKELLHENVKSVTVHWKGPITSSFENPNPEFAPSFFTNDTTPSWIVETRSDVG